jgi:hypothetical protein
MNTASILTLFAILFQCLNVIFFCLTFFPYNYDFQGDLWLVHGTR